MEVTDYAGNREQVWMLVAGGRSSCSIRSEFVDALDGDGIGVDKDGDPMGAPPTIPRCWAFGVALSSRKLELARPRA